MGDRMLQPEPERGESPTRWDGGLAMSHFRRIRGTRARLTPAPYRRGPRRYWGIPLPWATPVPRRQALRGAAGAVLLAGAALAGCAQAKGQTSATPAPANHPIHLYMLADTDSLTTNQTVQRLLEEALTPFLQANPDTDVQVGFMQGNAVIPSVNDPTAKAGGLRLRDRDAIGRLTSARQSHV